MNSSMFSMMGAWTNNNNKNFMFPQSKNIKRLCCVGGEMSLNDSERILVSEGLLTQCGSDEETLLHFEMSSVV